MSLHAERLEDGTLLRLVLDNGKGNVLETELMRALREALAAHRHEAALRLVILEGAGPHFSYGASVEEHRPTEAPQMLATFHGLIRDLAAYPVPGRCLGGAFELVLACHFVFTAADAVFACPEIKLGVFPPVLAAIGPLRLGDALAERLLLTGEDLSAGEARQAGLVTAIFDGEPRAALLAWYRSHLRPLSAYALRVATAASRSGPGWTTALDELLRALESRYVRDVLTSHDGNEGVEAFLAHRPPDWQDR